MKKNTERNQQQQIQSKSPHNKEWITLKKREKVIIQKHGEKSILNTKQTTIPQQRT